MFNCVQAGTRRLSYRPRMLRQFCETCGREGRWLEYSTDQARLDYYRCSDGHVWSIPKNNPKAAQTPVTRQVPGHATQAGR